MPEEMHTHSDINIKSNYSQIYASAFNYVRIKRGNVQKRDLRYHVV